jgi:ubiquinol-cytochrome c reductase cytochrome c subunit
MRRAAGVLARAALLALAALPLGAAHVADAAPPSGPPIVKAAGAKLGEQLFAANCARCHGIAGRGFQRAQEPGLLGPPLRGVGQLAADFYLRTGYMPLNDARDQPVRSRPSFDNKEIQAIVSYVGSLGKGPAIPTPDAASGDLEEGRELFTEHCSGCHQVVAEGGILPGAKAPPLNAATDRQIAEAVRIGPYVMPTFTTKDISDAELNSIIAYVNYTKDPDDRGGWGINHLGPYPEGMVTWLIAIPVLLIICRAIGKVRSSS